MRGHRTLATTKASASSSSPAGSRAFDVVTFIRKHVWFFLLALSCSAYAAWNLDRGWVAHDDGALAQSAERVLHGEMPHRDFDETYSGLLDYMHAGAFALFGTRLLSLRFPLIF